MKSLRVLTALTLILILLCGCGGTPYKEALTETETVGVWVTYSELDSMVNSGEGFQKSFERLLSSLKETGVNTLYFHALSFCDAAWDSEIYPSRYGTDILKAAVELSNKSGIALHAWINPYRVQTSSADKATMKESFAKSWLTDEIPENDKNLCFTENGIYLNPASEEVRAKIIGAIREIVSSYAVAGIHFDDYFYPTTSPEFDEQSYNEYTLNSALPLELSHWRRMNVNSLLLGAYNAVKAAGNGLLFGVSPAADLERCYTELYADVESWISGGYIDYIMPQLYFGFEYPIERFRFENLVIKWLDIAGNKTCLLVGLPMYKTATEATPDNEEWQKSNDIVARQIECVRQYNVSGFAFFSASSLLSENAANTEQLNNIKEVL